MTATGSAFISTLPRHQTTRPVAIQRSEYFFFFFKLFESFFILSSAHKSKTTEKKSTIFLSPFFAAFFFKLSISLFFNDKMLTITKKTRPKYASFVHVLKRQKLFPLSSSFYIKCNIVCMSLHLPCHIPL